MSLAEFAEGYLYTLSKFGFARRDTLRRDLRRTDFDSPALTELRAEIKKFWDLHGEQILASQGPPGLMWPGATSVISRHAGLEFARVRNRQKAFFSAADWGASLAAAMNFTAASMGRCIITSDAQGTIAITYPDAVRVR